MSIDKPNFFLLTGGPGVGKTALIKRRLAALSYEPIETPPGPVEARAAFVLEVVAGLGR